MIRDMVGTMSVMDQKENTIRCELKVAQELLAAVLSLQGKTVTADALCCQKKDSPNDPSKRRNR